MEGGEEYATFAHHLDELKGMRDREQITLNKQIETNTHAIEELARARKSHEEWQRKKQEMMCDMSSIIKDQLEYVASLTKLKRDFEDETAKGKRLQEDVAGEEATLNNLREMFEERRQEIQKLENQRKESLEKSEAWRYMATLIPKRDAAQQQVQELKTQKPEWESVQSELQQLADNFDTLSTHCNRLTTQVIADRKKTNQARQTVQSREERQRALNELIAMAKEDLLSTMIENSETKKFVTVIEAQLKTK